MAEYTLITGASEGLGAEFAKIAVRKGHPVILSARSEDKLEALATQLRRDGDVDVVVIPADLNELSEVDRLWEAASTGRRILQVINNAGLGRNGHFVDGGDAAWARELSSMSVNMTALTRMMKLAIPHMEANGKGRVLNVASTAAFMAGPNMAVYHATKAYVLSLSEAVAQELKGSGVTVTALCPGATETSFFDAANMRNIRLLKLSKPASAADVAMAGWMAAKAGERVTVPGVMNKIAALLPKILPRAVVTRITAKVMAKG